MHEADKDNIFNHSFNKKEELDFIPEDDLEDDLLEA